ncbi:hypothetical protein ACIBF5_22920 [Micromonospora sp. NPDC050417]|uniref:hypothetical protein n=1 Tax=Micromonospora sp. NPDC050417 TaxID=3364280 RepID=UPI0037939E3B
MTILQIGHVLHLQPADYEWEGYERGGKPKQPLRMRVTHVPDRLALFVAEWISLNGVAILDDGTDGEKLELAVHHRAMPDHPRLDLATPHFMAPLRHLDSR